jgi:hypothetical protein
MKKLLLLIACASAVSTHATLKDMFLTKLCKEYNNSFSGLTRDERQKRLTEAKNLKFLYEPRSDTTSIKVVRCVLTTEYFSDLTEREQHKVHKNPSDKLEKIIKRLTAINRSERIKQRKHRLMLQAKRLQQTN